MKTQNPTQFTIIYPKGGSNKMWEPIHIVAKMDIRRKLTVQGVTCGRNGCKISIFNEKQQEISSHNYDSGFGGPINISKVASDISKDMNIILGLLEVSDPSVEPEQLHDVMKEVVNKCESRYGNRLPDSDYEVLVTFE